MPNLNLNEALISVHKSDFASPIDVFYQNSECCGCQLEKFTTLNENPQDIVLDTRYGIQLEFRQDGSKREMKPMCSFDRLDLNSHGHYRIDIKVNSSEPNVVKANCDLQVLNQGECMICPFALLLCLLIAATAGEKLYTWFLANKKQHRNTTSDSTSDPNAQESKAPEPKLEPLPEVSAANANQGNTAVSLGSELTQKRRRIDALDAFRGFTITGMIMVNYGGAGYMILEHKPWNGLTLADLVFPFFIFSMGASIAISMQSVVRRNEHSLKLILWKIFRRSFILMALGLCLNSKWLGGRDLSHLRLTGVLQRFAISYLVVAETYAFELKLNKWMRGMRVSRLPVATKMIEVIIEMLVALICLATYIYLTYFFEYSPSCPAGYVGPGGLTEGGEFANCTGGAAAWLDHTILGKNHIYLDTELKHVFGSTVTNDPEGLLGYTTSILLTLIGLQCGKILTANGDNNNGGNTKHSHKQRVVGLIQWFVLMALLSIAVIANPINKKLWSLTFVSITSAIAYLVIASFYILVDIYQCQRVFILRLLMSAGQNAIFLYVGHSLLHEMLPWHFAVDETSHLQLTMRLAWSTFVWLLIANFMASKKLFIKI